MSKKIFICSFKTWNWKKKTN